MIFFNLQRKRQIFGIATVIGVAAVFINANSRAQSLGTFAFTGNLPSSQRSAVSLLLPSTMALMVGGIDSTSRLTSLVAYDPNSETFSNVGTMDAPYNTATLLNDGNVLLAGGGNFVSNGSGSDVLTSAELYDPGTGVLTGTGPALQGVIAPTAVRLLDGRVLLAGGKIYNQGGAPTAAAELYDPASGTFTFTGSMTTPRYNHSATLLPDGDVLIVGGSASSVTGAPLATAELYNSSSETFSAIGNMNTAHASHTATLLADGKVLVAGGSNQPPNARNNVTVIAELYDPATNTFAPTGAMQAPREFHQAVRLANGEVLVAGGDDSLNVLASTEVYDPTTGTFATDAPMEMSRDNFTATLLNNGDVLVAGGLIGFTEAADTATAELYTP
jgi:Kelch motif/Galactose oxidase, central domain